MAGYRLLLHKDYEESVRDLAPTTRRKATWAQVLLGTRGRTPIVKGTAGRNARWRRTPIQGNHYYMWWIPQSESPLADATIGIDGNLQSPDGNGRDTVNTILVHSVRHHDETDRPIRTGSLTEYRALPVEELDPRFDEQKAVGKHFFDDDLAVITIRGLPGSGKTIALLYLLKDLLALPGNGRILYITYTSRLKRAAREFIDSQARHMTDSRGRSVLERVQVLTLNEVMQEITGVTSYAEPFGELKEFYAFLDRQNPAELGPWRKYPRTLFTEIRAHLLGQDFPTGYDWAESNRGGAGIDVATYAEERDLDPDAAQIAYRLAERVRHMRFFRDQQAARVGLQLLIKNQAPAWIQELDALVIDEVQDLTLLQIAFLTELMRTRLRDSELASLRFALAGDESQIVQPSGFDWGMTKYLVGEQLDIWPDEYNFEFQRRSPDNLAELIDNSWNLYSNLPRHLRPSARSRRQQDGDATVQGRIYLAPIPQAAQAEAEIKTLREVYLAAETDLPPYLTATTVENAPPDSILRPSDILWTALLEEVAARPGRALVDLTEQLRPPVLQSGGQIPGIPTTPDAGVDEILFLPREIKGLERATILIHGLNELYLRAQALCEDKGDGNIPRFEARRLFDEIRVALSRSTDNLVLLEPPDAPVLQALDIAAISDVSSMGWADLIESMQTEEMSELEAIEGYLREVEDLLEREKWHQAFARNRRSHAMAVRLGDRALQHEADVQYVGGLLQQAESRLYQEDWQGAYAANRSAAEFAQQQRDPELRRRVRTQQAAIAARMGEQTRDLIRRAELERRERHFDASYRLALAAHELAGLVEAEEIRRQAAASLVESCWSWAAHLVDRHDVAEVASQTAALLDEASGLLDDIGDEKGARAMDVLAARYRSVPQAHDLSEEQVIALLDSARRAMAPAATDERADPDQRVVGFVRRWLYEAYGGLEDRVTLFYRWAAAAAELADLTGDHSFEAQIRHLEQRLDALLERAGNMRHIWDGNDELARFRALVMGIHGDHGAASAAWEALGDLERAAQQARWNGDTERAAQLYREAGIKTPRALAALGRLFGAIEQFEQHADALRPAERARLLARLDELSAPYGHQHAEDAADLPAGDQQA